jgi:hypothetical protein
MKKDKQNNQEEYNDFPIDVKRDIIDIINDTPSLVKIGEKEYRVKDMRYYSLYRICRIVIDMKKNDDTLKDDSMVLTALCTDLDAMCEIMAIIICNHLFTPDKIKMYDDVAETMSHNDKLIEVMKAKIMNSTFETNQWAAIILGAIKSIDLSGFFLLRKSVSTLTDSLLIRKKKSVETASLFTEAQSLQTRPTS